MPLLFQATVTDPEVENPELPPPLPPAPRPRFTWITPEGEEVVLDDLALGWVTPKGRSGLGAAPIDQVADPHPRGGARMRHIQPQPRIITWPLFIRGTDHMQFLGRWRYLARAFTMTRRLGAGRLRAARPDGSAREIEAFYQSGFDSEPGWGHVFDRMVLSLWCEDPFWRSTETLSTTYRNSAPVSYLDPYMTVSASSVLGATTAVNEGDVEAWPVWTIVGPASVITATNQATGEAWTVTPIGGALSAGQTVTVTTDPPTVRGPAGQVWTGALNWAGAVLWGLQPGSTPITFAVSGASTATTITLSYTPRHETA